MLNITRQSCAMPYPDDIQRKLFAHAKQHDVEKGGHYDARNSMRAIVIWTHNWTEPATLLDSRLIGALHFQWGETPGLCRIEAEAYFQIDDVLAELGKLERAALGFTIHGH